MAKKQPNNRELAFQNYGKAASENRKKFLINEEQKNKRAVLLKLCDFLKGIPFGLACSFNLYIMGIVSFFNDFDIIVTKEDFPKVHDIVISKLNGELLSSGPGTCCKSGNYEHFRIPADDGDVDIDLISDFKVCTFETQYSYDFNPESLIYIQIKDDIKLPLIPMEVQYVLYCMMEGWQKDRKKKRRLIQKFLEVEPTIDKDYFCEALSMNLPKWIQRKILSILMVHCSN